MPTVSSSEPLHRHSLVDSRTRIFFFAGRRSQYTFELSHAPSQFPFEPFGHGRIGNYRQCLRIAEKAVEIVRYVGCSYGSRGRSFRLERFRCHRRNSVESNRFQREREQRRPSKPNGQTNPWKFLQMSVYIIARIDTNRTIETNQRHVTWGLFEG